MRMASTLELDEKEKQRLERFFGHSACQVIIKHLGNLEEAFVSAASVILMIMKERMSN